MTSSVQTPVLDPVIHPPGRLQICAILSGAEQAEFAMVRDTIAVSDSVLSKHVRLLEESGYVVISKAAAAGARRTWLAMTPRGRAAFAGHVAELQRLAGLSRAGRRTAADTLRAAVRVPRSLKRLGDTH